MAMVSVICNSRVEVGFYLASIGELAKKMPIDRGIFSIDFEC
jgi:hypothetical protein